MDVPESRPSPLGNRFDEVCAARQMTARGWSLAAGQSERYLAVQRNRSADDPNYVLPEKAAAKLAEVAKVNPEWLRFGRGPRDVATTSPAAPVAVRVPRDAELALLEAFRRGSGTPEDVLAVLEVLRGGEANLPADRESAVATMSRMLRAAARLRRDQRPVNAMSLAWIIAGEHADANAEGREQLAGLGATPPQEPVRTPARGLPSVPVPVDTTDEKSERRPRFQPPTKTGT